MHQFTLINIDTIFEKYQQLITLYHKNQALQFETIELSLQQWFAANMCAALGGILDRLQQQMNTIRFNQITPRIQDILQRNDFLSHFGYERQSDLNRTTIKYLKLKPADGRFLHYYVIEELLHRPELPQMTTRLMKKITESIYEIFVNARLHSDTEFVYTCGQFFPNRQVLEFTITDTGIGFKNRINQTFGSTLSSTQAIKWAIRDGNSTRPRISGGIGLALLKEFIVMNRGKLQIISDDGFYQFDSEVEQTKLFSGSFPGTVINLQFRTDDPAVYLLTSETGHDDIF